jgi:hypothetical protein
LCRHGAGGVRLRVVPGEITRTAIFRFDVARSGRAVFAASAVTHAGIIAVCSFGRSRRCFGRRDSVSAGCARRRSLYLGWLARLLSYGRFRTAAVGVFAIRIVRGLCTSRIAWTFPASTTRGASTFVHAIVR